MLLLVVRRPRFLTYLCMYQEMLLYMCVMCQHRVRAHVYVSWYIHICMALRTRMAGHAHMHAYVCRTVEPRDMRAYTILSKHNLSFFT